MASKFFIFFLTLIASDARRGKLYAITARGVQHDHTWKSTFLVSSPWFHLIDTTKGAPSVLKLVVPAILPHLGLDMFEDCSLCLVQALKVCLAKTGNKNKELHFTYKDGLKGDLYTNLLSVWVRKLIHHVYQTAEEEVLPHLMSEPIKFALWGLHRLSGAVST